MMNCGFGFLSECTRAVAWKVLCLLGETCIMINFLLIVLVQVLSTESYLRKKKNLIHLEEKL